MPSKKLTLQDQGIDLIREVRGVRVILDSDLAALYGVTTKRLNEQFRRNRFGKIQLDFSKHLGKRFLPPMFIPEQLAGEEIAP